MPVHGRENGKKMGHILRWAAVSTLNQVGTGHDWFLSPMLFIFNHLLLLKEGSDRREVDWGQPLKCRETRRWSLWEVSTWNENYWQSKRAPDRETTLPVLKEFGGSECMKGGVLRRSTRWDFGRVKEYRRNRPPWYVYVFNDKIGKTIVVTRCVVEWKKVKCETDISHHCVKCWITCGDLEGFSVVRVGCHPRREVSGVYGCFLLVRNHLHLWIGSNGIILIMRSRLTF